jgi:hypothetical protein
MRTRKFTLSYAETRSAHYQSVRVGLDVECEVGESEDLEQAYKDALNDTVKRVRATADKAIRRYSGEEEGAS